MFASKHTRVEILSKSIPTLRKDLHFSASSHSVHEKVFPAKYHKSGKKPRKGCSLSFYNKKNLDKKLLYEAPFSRVMNNPTPKQRSSGDFAFPFPTLFESGN